MFICRDLAHIIIKYVKISELILLSRASPLLCREIYEMGYRIIQQGNFARRIDKYSGTIIQLESGRVLLIKYKQNDVYVYQELASCRSSTIEIFQKTICFGECVKGYYCDVDIKNRTVISHSAGILTVFNAVNITNDNTTFRIITENNNELKLPTCQVCVMKIGREVLNELLHIDFTNCFVADCIYAGYRGIEKFRIIWRNKKWE